MNVILLTIFTFLVAALQARFPTLWWLGGLRLEFVPAVAAYMALQLPLPRALGMAALAGLAQDALSGAPFGISALGYTVVALALNALREVIDPDMPLMHVATAAVMSVAGALIAFCVVGFGFGSLVKMVIVAILAGVIAPPVFLALHWLSRSMTEART
jgi:rod shape-determining protein MreD